jgi:hypothetical protein
MKGEKFRGTPVAVPRTLFEPLKPVKESSYGYCIRVRKLKKACMCYCDVRYAWVIRALLKSKVNVMHLMDGSKEIPEAKCLEYAEALKKMRGNPSQEYYYDDLLASDIAFWSKCGGVKVHEWTSIMDILRGD